MDKVKFGGIVKCNIVLPQKNLAYLGFKTLLSVRYVRFRPQLVRFINTIDITIYNITLKDSPAWTLHLANTTNVHANYVTITAATNGSNTDGFDIDCSVNVTVENSYYEGGG